jgi:superfamily II DNA/RNA helicase
MMFSATWPKEVEDLAKSYCSVLPVHIQVGREGITVNTKIRQVVEIVDEVEKYRRYKFYNIV